MSKNKNYRTHSKLTHHKRHKKELKPPFLQIVPLKPSSWMNHRLPEMLWAVLVIGGLDREKALEYFRFVAMYIGKNKECYDLTMTGISRISPLKRKEFVESMVRYSEEIRTILRPLALFPGLPGREEWSSILGQPNPNEDWSGLSSGVSKTIWHQSQEATDCRWIKILGLMVGERFDPRMEDMVRGILEYPNYGDLRSIRPSIRAAEMTYDNDDHTWPDHFWKYSFENTMCIPEEGINKKIETRRLNLSKEMERIKNKYLPEARKVHRELIDHYFENMANSDIDPRYEGAFGFSLFALAIYTEILIYRTSASITSRLNIRILVETLIVFKYLLMKEKKQPNIWQEYRGYGTGQLKLLFLKLQETNEEMNCINLGEIEELINEDKWIEFVPINIGHWDASNLRTISEEVGLKEIYDTLYGYTSGYVHANWGAIRESTYQRCFNALHRLHRVPTFDTPLMPGILNDAAKIINQIFECLSEAYPEFNARVSINDEEADASQEDKPNDISGIKDPAR